MVQQMTFENAADFILRLLMVVAVVGIAMLALSGCEEWNDASEMPSCQYNCTYDGARSFGPNVPSY